MPDFYTVVVNRTDAAFLTHETRNYGLSLQFNDGHIAWCVIDHRLNKYIMLQDTAAMISFQRQNPGLNCRSTIFSGAF